MKTKVILSLTISFLLFFIITSSLTKPVIASETIALPATDITDGAGPNILVGKDDTLEFLSALKFSGIDTDRSVTSAYLQLTGESGIAKQMNVAVAENSWSNGAPLLPGLTGPSVNVSLGSPIEYYPENAKYSIDVSPLLMDPSNIGPPSGTISFVLSSDDSSFFFANNDHPEYAPKLVIEYGAPLDEDPPVFTGASPNIFNVTSNSATLRAQLNEPGTVYYVLVASESQAPSNEQVKAGQQETGEPALSGSFNVDTASTDVDYLIPDLIGNTAYDLYVVAEDELGNLQLTVTKLAVQTLNSLPTDLQLSATTIGESAGSGADVGVLSTTDQDVGDSHTYALVSGEGDDDNSKFQISGNLLRTSESLTPGTYSVRIRTTDEAGATFEGRFAISVVDDIRPAAPVINTPADGTITTNTKPYISGSAEASSTVTIFINGTSVGTVTATSGGDWGFNPSVGLMDGMYSITATATDAANNTSLSSTAISITIDTTAPTSPNITSPSAGTATSDVTPTIIGTAEPSSTVTVMRNGESLGTTTADGSGVWSFTSATEWSEGSYNLTAYATDVAGNTSVNSASVSITIDTTAPEAPIITSPSDGTVISAALPTISGSAESGSMVHVYRDGVLLGTTRAEVSEDWSFTDIINWTDGTYTIYAMTIDPAGNTSVDSAPVTVTIDTTAPSAPIIISPIDGAITANTQPEINGTAEPDSTVEVFREGDSQGTALVDGEGNWSLTPADEWLDGAYRITAKATDKVGNISDDSIEVAITIDTIAPDAPTITSPLTGTLSSDAMVSISGRAEAGSTVEVYRDGVLLDTATTDGSEDWTYSPTSAWSDGTYSITARAIDAAGNSSVDSAAILLTIDATIPEAPTITNPSSAIVSADAKPTISGTAEADSTVIVYRGGTEDGSTVADGSGNWTYTPLSNWSEGTHTVTVKAVDAAGNTSDSSTAVAITIDTTAPIAPIITSPLHGAVTSDAMLSINGTAEEDSLIEIFRDGDSQGTTIADERGDWTFTASSAWSDGAYSIIAKATDAVGNTSDESATISVIIDTTAPAAPIIDSPIDGTVSPEATPTISGTAESDSTVEVFREGVSQGTTTADGSGDWTFTPTSAWPDGTYSITIKATDTAGNTSVDSEAVVLTIDTTAPSAPIITSPMDGTVIAEATPTISGTAEADSTIEVFSDGISQGTTTADGSGDWTFTPTSAWSDGPYSITAKATDAADNTSVEAAAVMLIIDTTAPSAPSIASPSDGTVSAIATPTISGTAEADSTVEVFREGTSQGTTIADGSGNWSYTPTSAWSDGTHSITVRAIDAAGNTSDESAAVILVIDATAPNAPSITSPTDGAVSNDTTPTIIGNAEADSIVEVFRDGTSQGTTIADESGDWTFTPTSAWSDGTHSLTARATDAVGNTSDEAEAVMLVIDTIAPSEPSIASPSDGTVTIDATPTISGAAEEDSIVEVFRDGDLQGTTIADGSGEWTFTPTSAWSDGTHSITARATDAAGNTSAESLATTISIDTTAPSAPSITSPSDGKVSNEATPTIRGTAEADSTVELFRDGDSQGTTTADGSGDWTFTPTSAWPDGTHSITAKATDAAGNTGVESAEVTLVIDTTAPSAPSITSPSDGTVSNEAIPTISGTAEGDSTVEVFREGVSQGTTIADENGDWTFIPSSAWSDGPHSITTRATDAAHNTSDESAVVMLVIDTIAPSAPIITSPSDGAVSTDATPTISGTAEADSTVEVFKDGASQGTTTADGSGDWTFTPTSAWSDGTYSITAKATDAAGNTSTDSTEVTLVVDATAPTAPIITSPIDGTVNAEATPTISGTAEADSVVEVFRDGDSQGTTTADGSGDWTFTVNSAWSDGAHSITARATDAAGNTSDESVATTIIIDTTAPSAPSITSPSDEAVSTDATPTISGTAEADSTVEVFRDGTSQGTTIADENGDWTYTPTSAWSDGTYSITAKATDAAGNTSDESAAVKLVLDATAPSAPSIASPIDGTVSPDATPTISGTAEANSTVEVFRDGDSQGTTIADGNGDWTFTLSSAWSDGTYSITAKATDAAGNTSDESAAVTLVLDATAPIAPSITSPSDGTVSTEGTPIIIGTAEADSTVEVFRDGDSQGTTTADGNGDWTFTVTGAWSDGTYSITAKATDAAGNTSDESVITTITIDATAPSAPSIVSPSDGNVSADTTPTISGTAEADSVVEVFRDGQSQGTTTADENGDWTFIPTIAWEEGTHSITATATDAAGNTSTDATVITLVVDTTSPVITLIGESSIRIVLGTNYADQGATALDTRQGDLTSSIVVTNNVDTDVIGEHTVTYYVEDEAGNAALAVERTVIVIPPAVTVAGSTGDRTIAVSDAIPGATLTLYDDKQAQVGEQGTADPDGMFVFQGVLPGQGYYVTQTVNGLTSDPSLPIDVSEPSIPTQPVPVTPENARKASIIFDGHSKDIVVQVDIVRVRNQAGKIEDMVVLNGNHAMDIVEEALTIENKLIHVLIDDIPNEPVDEVNLSIERDFIKKLATSGLSVNIVTDYAAITLSQQTLQQVEQQGKSLSFSIVPSRNESVRREIAKRIAASEQVNAITGGGDIKHVGTLVNINAITQAKATIPLLGIELPQDKTQLQQLLNSLAVYMESSEGAVNVQRGKLVYDVNGKPEGIEIDMSSFTTFAIFSFDAGKHTSYVSGYADGTFAPNRKVTRGELAAMLSRLLSDELKSNAPSTSYRDVAATHWSAQYLANVQQLGLMNGYPDGTFRPDQPVTRAEFANAVVRLLDGKRGEHAYTVNDIEGHWAYGSMRSMLEKGAMKGYLDGTFRPNAALTRAEAVSALNRMFERQPLKGLENPYSDVAMDHWAYGDILEASVEHSPSEH